MFLSGIWLLKVCMMFYEHPKRRNECNRVLWVDFFEDDFPNMGETKKDLENLWVSWSTWIHSPNPDTKYVPLPLQMKDTSSDLHPSGNVLIDECPKITSYIEPELKWYHPTTSRRGKAFVCASQTYNIDKKTFLYQLFQMQSYKHGWRSHKRTNLVTKEVNGMRH